MRAVSPKAYVVLNVWICLYLCALAPAALGEVSLFIKSRYLQIDGGDLPVLIIAVVGIATLVCLAYLVSPPSNRTVNRTRKLCLVAYSVMAAVHASSGNLPAFIAAFAAAGSALACELVEHILTLRERRCDDEESC